MGRKVGVREVAERAGVSMGTVSNVVNGLTTVSPENVERVQRAIQELGFVPNSHARQLRGGRSDVIGMLVLNVGNPFFADVAHVVQELAQGEGSPLVIASSDQDPDREARLLTMFEESRARGLLVAPVRGVTPGLVAAHRRGMPIVLLDEHADGEQFCSVSLDGTAGGYAAASHLVELGRRRLAFVGGPLAQVTDRLAGVSRAVDECPGALMTVFEVPDLTVDQGRVIGRRIAALDARDRPDGIFAANDLVALGVLAELQASGIGVPTDVALVGYDDIDYAKTAAVPLTSVAQPRTTIATEALRLILEEERSSVTNPHVHEQRRLVPELVIRASTVGPVDAAASR
ncbi:LacI family DNA-binding transcriptional regulator [Demequina iriomotensis]|uniref:LacI family DNA-binding transcriptional regulator n=1 Tax=Demequina iriomotensis TaxID=1536641 RepID=UPI0007853B81|nr:LacI family DNA-binding transcriptional regulator [Demequina iriomotensis]